MLIIKLSEREDGTIIAETPRQVLGRFPNQTREDVIAYLRRKAIECDEQLRIVESFDDIDVNANVNFAKLMKRHF